MSGPRVTTEQARECLVACPIDTILMQDLAADLLDARAEIATLRAKLAAVCEAVSEYIAATDAANAAALANDAIGPHWAKRNAAYDALAALAAAREGEK